LSAALVAVAVILAVSGGFRTTVGGLRISARSPLPIVVVALLNASMWYSAARRHQSIAADLEAIWNGINRHAPRIIAAFALAMAIVTAVFSTRSAAGADASGYLSEAASLSTGRLFHEDDLAALTREHDPFLTSPLGWRPAPSEARQSPTYPPGLPLLMAIPHAIAGVSGASAVVVGSAALAVWATAMLAMQLAGGGAGVIAAALLAFTPVFIHQSIQPMSDVPVTAAWMLCFLLLFRNNDTWSGAICAIAVLIRPNLAPLAIVPVLLAGNRIAFAIPVAIAGVGLAAMQWFWYGSPLRSGYGSTDQLFAFTNIAANASRYVGWVIAASPLMLLSVLGAARVKGSRFTQGLLTFAILVIGAYLVYAVFDDWSYLRFLLPALAVFAILAAVGLIPIIDRAPVTFRAAILFTLILGVVANGIWIARSKDTFKLSTQLQRVEGVADWIRGNVEPNAVLLSGEQSGSMRYYTGRSILRWEAASPESLTAALATLEQSSRPVYIVLDAWENERFRLKLGSVAAVALDWPPALEAGTSHRTRVWRVSDRARFLRGEPLDIIRR
jgi:hypothetical protein